MNKIITRKNDKGITLIALVITIIVLLILAGVSIAMLTGQNGILTQAQSAKTANENKSAEEKVKLSIMAARSQSETGALDADKLVTEVTTNYGGTAEKTGDGFPVMATIEGKSFTVDENGTVVSSILSASDIAAKTDKSQIYGAKVTGYTLPSGTTTDVGWKIFYADNNNIYLIADNYVERTNLPGSTGGTSSHQPNDGYSGYARAAYFTNILGDYVGASRITDSKLKTLNNDYFNTKGFTSTNNNMKSVAYMMDTTAWNNKFKGDKADYAIGGPTVELLFKSYNEKYKTAYESQAASDTGYQIRKTSSNSFIDYANSMLTANDSLYVITKQSDAYAYWLASPSANEYNGVIGVDHDGCISIYYCGGNTYGFRPIICLKSDVTLQKISDTEYAIQ